MKRVYFVRHGESESNVSEVVQGLHDVLTPEGERQALRIAERVKEIAFDTLLASDAVRTQMTAKAVTDATGKNIESSALFRELKRPTSIIGRPRESEEYQTFMGHAVLHAEDSSWHYEDEENFFDGVLRAKHALSYLESHTSDRIVVVTHGLFLKFMVSVMVLGEKLTPELFAAWNAGFRASNTGLTHCILKEDGWLIVSWNDLAHFAE